MKKLNKETVKRISVNHILPEGKHLKFDIYSDARIYFLDPIFKKWINKTKIYSPESFCRFARKRNRKITLLSENQYLNELQRGICFIMYQKS